MEKLKEYLSKDLGKNEQFCVDTIELTSALLILFIIALFTGGMNFGVMIMMGIVSGIWLTLICTNYKILKELPKELSTITIITIGILGAITVFAFQMAILSMI